MYQDETKQIRESKNTTDCTIITVKFDNLRPSFGRRTNTDSSVDTFTIQISIVHTVFQTFLHLSSQNLKLYQTVTFLLGKSIHVVRRNPFLVTPRSERAHAPLINLKLHQHLFASDKTKYF